MSRKRLISNTSIVFARHQRVPSKRYKENYDKILWDKQPIEPKDFNGLQATTPGGRIGIVDFSTMKIHYKE